MATATLTAPPTDASVVAARVARRIAIVESHGFRAVMADDGRSVSVELPYTTAEGKRGTMWETATTMAELRAILGY